MTTPDTLGAPVTLDTDVYVPDGTPPPTGFPLLEMFHGGGSTKDNAYDAAPRARFADDGYVVADLLRPRPRELRRADDASPGRPRSAICST